MEILTIEKIRKLQQKIKVAIELGEERPNQVRNLSQMQILFYLYNNEDKTVYQKDIGEALKLKKSSITEHLDYLESAGIIVREQEQKDKRKNSIHLSEKAKLKSVEINNSLKRINEKVVRGISQEELECFEKVMRQMEENLK